MGKRQPLVIGKQKQKNSKKKFLGKANLLLVKTLKVKNTFFSNIGCKTWHITFMYLQDFDESGLIGDHA